LLQIAAGCRFWGFSMSFVSRLCGAAALSLLVLSSFALAAPPPVEAYGNLPEFSGASLSPDGKHIAIIRPIKGATAVFIYDTGDFSQPPHPFGLEGAVAEQILWPNNDRLIAVFRRNLKQEFSKDIYSWSRAISMKVDASDPVVLLHDEEALKHNLGTNIVDMPAEDPFHVYMTVWESDAMLNGHAPLLHDTDYLNLFRVNVNNGLAEMVLHGTENEIKVLMDGHGHPIGHVDQDSNLRDHLFVGTREVGVFDARGGRTIDFEGVTASANPMLAVRSSDTGGHTGLYTWQMPAGVGTSLFADQQYDMDDTLTDHSGRVIGATYSDDRDHAVYFDPATEKLQKQLEGALPGRSVSILSQDAAGATFAVEADGPKNPPTLYIFRPATHQLAEVLGAYPNLSSADLGEMKPYPYKARDGIDIHAYLTLPPGRDPKNLPVVILPHGGPEARDKLEFDWLPQFLASRGYAVLQPNFRGSSGYGWSFVQAGDGQWGEKVQYDVQDGVKKLIADGVADPRKICIMGWSYGGYMALAGATFSPDLYACAISFAGLSDLSRMLYTGTDFDSESVTVWERRIGASRGDSSKLAAISPARHADQVKAPILLMHADKDVTVPIEQSKVENEALKDAHKDVQFVTMEGDDHQLSYAANRIRMLQETEKFLAAHIGQ
jgi:dienelactone hydrolase